MRVLEGFGGFLRVFESLESIGGFLEGIGGFRRVQEGFRGLWRV